MAMGHAEVAEGERFGHRTWNVVGKTFAWVRPFSKADIKRFGDARPPEGPIVAVRVEDLAEKEAVLAAQNKGFFTIPHFDGYAAVLIELPRVTKRAMRNSSRKPAAMPNSTPASETQGAPPTRRSSQLPPSQPTTTATPKKIPT